MFGWPIVGLGDVDGDDVEDWASASVQIGCGTWDDEQEGSYVTAVSGGELETLWTLERASLWNPFGFALERVSATQLAIGFPATFHDECGLLVADPRTGSVTKRWPSTSLGLGRNEVTGASLALLRGRSEGRFQARIRRLRSIGAGGHDGIGARALPERPGYESHAPRFPPFVL